MLPGGRTVVAFRGRILALGRGNLQMSWYKCPGVPQGQPPGMAADKCIIPVYVVGVESYVNCLFHFSFKAISVK